MSFPDLLHFSFSSLFCFSTRAFYHSAFGILSDKPTEKCRGVKSGNNPQCVLTGRTWINTDWFSNNLLTSVWSSLWNIYFPWQGLTDLGKSRCRSRKQVLNKLILHYISFWILAKSKGFIIHSPYLSECAKLGTYFDNHDVLHLISWISLMQSLDFLQSTVLTVNTSTPVWIFPAWIHEIHLTYFFFLVEHNYWKNTRRWWQLAKKTPNFKIMMNIHSSLFTLFTLLLKFHTLSFF